MFLIIVLFEIISELQIMYVYIVFSSVYCEYPEIVRLSTKKFSCLQRKIK